MNKFLASLALIAISLFPITGLGQTPGISNGTPAESFLGEQFCFDAEFTNTGSPGYGPYFQLILPPGLTFDSATIFGSSAIIQNVGVFPASPGNQLLDPRIDMPVTGPEGGTLIIIGLPVGSVVTGGPALNTKICLTIEPTAVVGVPLDVTLVPIYEFGDTATGDNGPIVGSPNTVPVTPTVIRFAKTNTAPESERPPTSGWPFNYVLTANIANTATVENLEFNDVLPATVQFVGISSIMGGVNCAATSTPSTITPGGTLTVTCDSATGTTADNDVEVIFSVHFTDILTSDDCNNSLVTNAATLDTEYNSNPLPQLNDDTDVTAKHLAMQKGEDVSPGTTIPGDVVTYTLNLQLDDTEDFNNLVVTDMMPDGLTFLAHQSMTVAGNPVVIVPLVTPNIDGTTTIVYDIGSVAGTIAGGSSIQVRYTATFDQAYVDTGLPVQAGDSLSNTVSASYGTVAGATACSEGSGASVTIDPVSASKTIVDPQPFYVPGETVTFRLTLNVASGDTRNIVMVDSLPLPVFDATTISTTWLMDISPGPDDTAGLIPTSIMTNAALNSLTIEWPDISGTTPKVLQVDVDVVLSDDPFADGLFLTNILQVTTENSSGQETKSLVPVQLQVGAPSLVIAKGISASTNANSAIDPPNSIEPIDGNLTGGDAGDTLTYVLTVENIGSAEAFDVTITDPVVSGLTSCVVITVQDGGGSNLGFTPDLFTGGLVLDDPLQGNDANPPDGGAPYSDDTAVVTYTCDVDVSVNPNQVITNTASVSWASQAGAVAFPAVEDDATATMTGAAASKLFVSSSESSTSDTANPPRATIGEVVRYRLVVEVPEGTIPSLNLVDTLPDGLAFISTDNDDQTRAAFISNGAGMTSSIGAIPNINGNSAALVDVPSTSITFDLTATSTTFSLGNVVNNDNDEDAEFLVVEFNALVLNEAPGGNDAGENRDNSFQALQDTNILATSNNHRIRLAEPQLTLMKTANPTVGEGGDLITYTIALGNPGGDNNTTAFDVVLADGTNPLLTNVAVQSITPSGGCSGISDTSSGNDIDVMVAVIPPLCTVTVVYTANLVASVEPGTSISNTAMATWTSLPGSNGTVTNPTGANAPDASGTAQGERNGISGGVNNYMIDDDAEVIVRSVTFTKTVTDTSQPSTGQDQVREMIDDLTIGETADFQIVATIPQGVTPQVLISDVMPYTNGVMEILSAEIVSVGMSLTTEFNPASPAVLQDTQLMDGINDYAEFNFGQVTNTPDGMSDENDQIVIALTGVVRDLPQNVTLDELTNTATVQFGTGLNATAEAEVDVVEPIMTISKDGDITQGDAGDTVTFTLTIDHSNASTADGFDVLMSDTLPANLTLLAGSLTYVSGLMPDDLNEVGNGVEAVWNTFDLLEDSVLSFQATIDITAMPAEVITNSAGLDWTSLPGDGDPNDRMSSTDNAHSITITSPGVTKVITDTSVDETGLDQFGMETDLTIGEVVTYQFTVVLPEGLTQNAIARDQLPTGSSILSVVSSRLVSIGGNLMGVVPAINDPGLGEDTNMDTFNDRVTWNLGDITNTPDGNMDEQDTLVFEVVAVVLDESVNQSGVLAQTNTASLITPNTTVMGTVDVDIVAPQLSLTKLVTFPDPNVVDAGDTVTYQLTIEHTAASTAEAFSILLTETLPDPQLMWIGDGTVMSTCTGLTIDSSAAPLIEFEFPALSLVDGSCTISYDTTVDLSVQPGEEILNLVELQYDSTPVFVLGETRRLTTSAFDDVIVNGPSFVKLATLSSLDDTGSDQGDPLFRDLTIGETVTYELTIRFPEGTINNVIVTDLLPASAAEGYMEVVGANVQFLGNNIMTSQPGTPVIDDFQEVDGFNDRVRFDFGTVTNSPDNMSNAQDEIVVQIVARVLNVPENMGGDELVNMATFEFGTNGLLEDTATIEVVEPILDLTKTMGPVINGVVRLTLAVENTGTAPAYDINVTDVLDNTVWDSGSLNIISVSTGFELATAPGPGAGETTLTLSTDPLAVSPAGTIPVSTTITAVFELTLAQIPPVPNPVINIADLDGADTLPGADDNARDLPPDQDQTQIGIPDLVASKQDDLLIDQDNDTFPSPGDTLRYTLVVSNQGVANATNVVLADTPDSNSSLVVGSVTTSQGSVITGNTAGNTTIEVDIGIIPPQGSVTITYDTTINNPLPSGVSELVNQATVNSTELPEVDSDDPDEPGAEDPTVVPIMAAPDLTITKDDGGTTTVPGGTVTYNLSYQNNGTQDATGVVISDIVPANASFNAAASTAGWVCVPDASAGSTCTLALGSVGAGDPPASVTFAITVDNPLPMGVTQISNTTGIADDGNNGPDLNPDDNSDSDTTPVDAAPDLTISKDDGDVTVMPGNTVPYTLTYQNIGTQNATGVVITDTVPANTSFNAGASTAGWVCLPDGNAGSTCTLAIGDVAAGDPPASATFAVTVDNPLPMGVTQISNTTGIADDGNNGPDLNPDDNSGSDTTPVDAAPDLTISKDDGDATTVPGGTIAFTLSYQNIGTQNATGVVITDTVPANTSFNAGASTAGWVCLPDGSAGSTCTLAIGDVVAGDPPASATFAVIVDNPLPSGIAQISNATSIADDGNNGPDLNPDNNSGSDTTPVDAAPDLTISKDDGDATAVPGGTIAFTLSYQNIGTQDATGVVITDTVPANSSFNAGASTAGWACVPDNNAGSVCSLTIGDVAAGDPPMSVTFAVDVVDPLPAGVESLLNTSSIADDGNNGPDLNPDDNSDSDTTPLDAAPDLTISKDDGDVTVMPGDTVPYILTYQNVGTQDATGVVITDTVPANSSFNAGASTAGWACVPDNNAGSVCSLTIGDVAAGDPPASATFAVTVDNPLPSGITQISNATSIADDGNNGPDLNPDDNSGSDTTPVDAAPDLTISKDDGDATAVPGGTIAFTLSYQNIGTQNATGVVITDTVPANTSFNAGASTAGWVCLPDGSAGSTCTLAIGDVVAGDPPASATFAVIVDNPLPSGIAQISNATSIADDGNNGPDLNPDNNSGSDTTPVDAAPDLTISKNDGDVTVMPGDTVPYTLIYQNVGNQDANGVVITDTVPANASFNAGASTAGWVCVPDNNAGSVCSLTIGDVAAGDPPASVTFAVDVVDPLPAGVENLLNTSSIADDGNNGPDPTPEDNSDSDTTPVDAQPDLVITKDDGDITVMPGDTVAYTLTYQNVGNQDATGVIITDTVPANSTFNAGASTPGWMCVPDGNAGSTCTLDIGAVASGGASGTATFAVTVDNPLPAGITEINNTTSIADDGNNGIDPTPGNNSDSDDTPVDAAPDLNISKDDGDFTAMPGDTVPYTLTYQNVGNQDATGVVITDTVPANASFNAGASTAGWVCVPDASAGSTCTLAIGDVAAGDPPASVTFAVDVVDPLPAGVEELLNTASIADDGNNGADPTPEDNSDSDTTPLDATPDLTISKDDGDVTVMPGDTVAYTLTYQNVGNQDATGVVITDTVPDNSSFNAGASTAGWVCLPDASAGSICTLAIGDVAAGDPPASVTFAVDVPDPLPAGVEDLLNTASIADDGTNGPDPTPEDNSDSDTTPVDATPDLTISKDDGGATTVPGGTVVYTLTYQNVGNQDATGVVITDTVPDNSSFNAGASTAGWVCLPDASAGSICTLAIGDVAAGDPPASVTFAVDVLDPLPAGVEELLNTASIADDGNNGPDPTPEDNSDSDTTPVDATPDLTISKDDGGIETVAPGDVLVYTLTYQNVGNQDATGVVITETVPDNTTFEAGSSEPGWVCVPDTAAGSTCTLDLGEVMAGADPVTVTFAVRLVTPWPPGVEEITNSVSIADDGSNGPDPTPENNADTVATEVGGPVSFRVTKEFTDDNPMEVDVVFSCNTGLPIEQTSSIAEGDEVNFVITSFTPGELNCEVYEIVPEGYTPDYEAIDDPQGSAVDVYDDENGCYYDGVSFGAFECRITNTPNPVPIVIEKQWLVDGGDAPYVDARFELILFCNGDIVNNDAQCPAGGSNSYGPPVPAEECKYFEGFGNQTFTAEVIPDYPATQCHVFEYVQSGGVEVENGCLDLEVSAGQGDSCLVVNTVWFQGIPTLNQYGMALLALLMLGMGFVATRRLI